MADRTCVQETQEAMSTSPPVNLCFGFTMDSSIATGGCGRIIWRRRSRVG